MDESPPVTITTVEQLAALAGRELGAGRWFRVTQELVNAFADLTGDHQYIHVDPERAARTMFGGPIAHGYLTLSLLPRLLQERDGPRLDLGAHLTVNYGLNRVRFPGPVHVGRRIRVRTTLLAVDELPHPGGPGPAATPGGAPPRRPPVQVTWQQTVEVEGAERPGMVAETLTRYYF